MAHSRLDSDERRQTIVDAAVPLFARKGFAGTTTRELAEAAGISEALVATAIGLAVAIPAVLAFNIFQRLLKRVIGRSNALGNAIASGLHLKNGSK